MECRYDIVSSWLRNVVFDFVLPVDDTRARSTCSKKPSRKFSANPILTDPKEEVLDLCDDYLPESLSILQKDDRRTTGRGLPNVYHEGTFFGKKGLRNV